MAMQAFSNAAYAHSRGSSRYFVRLSPTPDPSFIFVVPANPEPDKVVSSFHREGSIVRTDTNSPIVTGFLESE